MFALHMRVALASTIELRSPLLWPFLCVEQKETDVRNLLGVHSTVQTRCERGQNADCDHLHASVLRESLVLHVYNIYFMQATK